MNEMVRFFLEHHKKMQFTKSKAFFFSFIRSIICWVNYENTFS